MRELNGTILKSEKNEKRKFFYTSPSQMYMETFKVALNGTDEYLYYALVKVLTVPNGVYIAPNGVIRIKKD